MRPGDEVRTGLIRTMERLYYMAQHLRGAEIPEVILLLLIDLNVPVGSMGFEYLRSALAVFLEDPEKIMLRGIYETVAESCGSGVTPDQIEQDIRSAIKKAWERRHLGGWGYYFDRSEPGSLKRPTSQEFIFRIGYILELYRSCVERVAADDSMEKEK